MNAGVGEGLAASVIDALTSNICIVDLNGVIVSVSRAWLDFSNINTDGASLSYLGENYLDVCRRSTGPDSEEALEIYAGMINVLEGSEDLFQIEYPCHSPTELRWFLARVTPLAQRNGPKNDKRQIGAVVSHVNITFRKLLQLDNARLASTGQVADRPSDRFFEDNARIELERFRRFKGAMASTFAAGHLVRLKSGGPTMTVERYSIKPWNGEPVVYCTWYDEINRRRFLRRETFHPLLLEHSPSESYPKFTSDHSSRVLELLLEREPLLLKNKMTASQVLVELADVVGAISAIILMENGEETFQEVLQEITQKIDRESHRVASIDALSRGEADGTMN